MPIVFFLLSTFAFAHQVDVTKLPLGDGKISTSPKKGWIWACHTDPGGRGAFRDGPWIKQDGTFDFTAKPVVPGNVKWPHQLRIEVKGSKRVFSFDDLPDHGTGIFPIDPGTEAYQYDRNPNHIMQQFMSFETPVRPVVGTPSCAPGAVGILLSGVVLFNALDAPGRDALAHEVQDHCQGHPQISGVYHYHSLSDCVKDDAPKGKHSHLIGYALDGFGIYGFRGEHGKELTSQDLDECHGHTHAIEWDGKKVVMYHYHATRDFPYTVGCMRGSYDPAAAQVISGPPPGMIGRRPPPRGPWGGRPPAWGPPGGSPPPPPGF